jgi:hypothetical protein
MFRRLSPLQLLVVLTAIAAAIFGASPISASTPSNPVGYFVVGDNAARAAGASGPITWWSSSWWSDNALSGGLLAPSQFKGYAITFSGGTPVCGGTWTTGPGNSPHPPDSVAGAIQVIITSSVTATADTITGNIVGFGTVTTDPGYGPSPGRRGTGTIITNSCGE